VVVLGAIEAANGDAARVAALRAVNSGETLVEEGEQQVAFGGGRLRPVPGRHLVTLQGAGDLFPHLAVGVGLLVGLDAIQGELCPRLRSAVALRAVLLQQRNDLPAEADVMSDRLLLRVLLRGGPGLRLRLAGLVGGSAGLDGPVAGEAHEGEKRQHTHDAKLHEASAPAGKSEGAQAGPSLAGGHLLNY